MTSTWPKLPLCAPRPRGGSKAARRMRQVEQHGRRSTGLFHGDVRHAQIIENHLPAAVPRGAGVQALFAGHETDRGVGPHHRARRPPGVGVQTAWQIQRQHRPAAGVDGGDGIGYRTDGRSIEARSEQGVDHHIGAGERRRRVLELGAATGQKPPPHHVRLAGGAGRAGDRGQVHVEPGQLGQLGHHVAVAAVVARPAQYRQALRRRPQPA